MRVSHPDGKGGEALITGEDGGSVFTFGADGGGGGGDVRVSIVTDLRGSVTINAELFILKRTFKEKKKSVFDKRQEINKTKES